MIGTQESKSQLVSRRCCLAGFLNERDPRQRRRERHLFLWLAGYNYLWLQEARWNAMVSQRCLFPLTRSSQRNWDSRKDLRVPSMLSA